MTFSAAIQGLVNGKAVKPNTWGGYVARVDTPPEFSESSTYAVGDLVSHGGKAYRCSAAVSSAGSWTGATNWTELFDLVPEFSAQSTYAVGAKVRHNGAPYECVSAVGTAAAWDLSKWSRLVDFPHVLVFQERADDDGDSATVYSVKCDVSLAGGRAYGSFAPAFAMDSELLRAVVWDTTWAAGDRAAYEAARTGSNRW